MNLKDLAAGILGEITKPIESKPAKYRISQSRIKTFTDKYHCPVRVYHYDIACTVVKEETESMRAGQLFEYLTTGATNRAGLIPEMTPLKKKNKFGNYMSTDEIRVREQARRFPIIMKEHGIEMIEADVKISFRYDDDLEIDGIIDFRGRRRGEPRIFDIKLVGSIHDTFGYYSFGDPFLFDYIQSQIYMTTEKRNYGIDLPFTYIVFDNKPILEYKFLDNKMDSIQEMEMHQRIKEAYTLLKSYTEHPPLNDHRPGYMTCRGCQVPCQFKVTTKPNRVDYATAT